MAGGLIAVSALSTAAGLTAVGDGGEPGLPGPVTAEDGPRHDQHGAIGGRVEGEAAERHRAGAGPPDPVLGHDPLEQGAQPLLPGGEAILTGGQRNPCDFPPAHQPGSPPHPGQGRGGRGRRREPGRVLGRDTGQQVTGVGDGHGAGREASGLRRGPPGSRVRLAGRHVIPVGCHGSRSYDSACNGTFVTSVYVMCDSSPARLRGSPRLPDRRQEPPAVSRRLATAGRPLSRSPGRRRELTGRASRHPRGARAAVWSPVTGG